MNRINPDRLKEIRLMRGCTLENVAARLNVSKQAVSKYERGLSLPGPDAIDRMIAFFEIPRGYLTKDSIPSCEIQSPLFFRAKKSTKRTEKDIAAIYAKWIYEMLAETDVDRIRSEVRLPVYPDGMSIEEKALELRKDWDLGLGTVDNLTSVMENNGINVLAVNASDSICDAYSQVIDGLPIVIINRDVGSAVLRRFNLAHELGHLVLHTGMKWNSKTFDDRFDELERDADLFAESFLMPAHSFGACVVSDKLDYFITLKREWKVSLSAMICRSGHLKIINGGRVIQLQKQLSKRGWKLTEPMDEVLDHEEPQRIRMCIKDYISDKNAADEFITHVSLPITDMQRFLGLSDTYFDDMGISIPQYINNNEYQQLSLF